MNRILDEPATGGGGGRLAVAYCEAGITSRNNRPDDARYGLIYLIANGAGRGCPPSTATFSEARRRPKRFSVTSLGTTTSTCASRPA